MGKSIMEWETMIKDIDTNKLKEYETSLSNLIAWKEFNNEYQWTGLSTIKTIIILELKNRGV